MCCKLEIPIHYLHSTYVASFLRYILFLLKEKYVFAYETRLKAFRPRPRANLKGDFDNLNLKRILSVLFDNIKNIPIYEL